MKTYKNVKRTLYTFIVFLMITSDLFELIAQINNYTLYTPEGMPFESFTEIVPLTPGEIATMNQDIMNNWIIPYGLNAVLIGNPTYAYRCSGYAFIVSEGGIETDVSMPETIFNGDQSYSNDGLPSYLVTSESEATQSKYLHIDHYARKIQNSYPVAVQNGRDYVSKWGAYGTYHHQKNHDPYNKLIDYPMVFYKLKTSHSGTLSNHPKHWLGNSGRIHSVSNDLTVSVGTVLNIESGTVSTASGTKIHVSGVLNATNVTFTGTNWSGIQFEPGGTGTISSCNINNVYGGAGICIANGYGPLIENNIINNLQGSAMGIAMWDVMYSYPTIRNNFINGPIHGIYMHNSNAFISNNNSISGTQSALCLYGSNAFLHPADNIWGYGNNAFYNSDVGLSAYMYSNVYAGGNGRNGYFNSFFSNTSYNVLVANGSQIYAENNTWSPLPPQKIYCDNDSYIDYNPVLSSGLPKSYYIKETDLTIEDNFWMDLKAALQLRLTSKLEEAFSYYKSLLNKYSGEKYWNNIVADLGDLYKESKNENIKIAIKELLWEKEKNLLLRPFILRVLSNLLIYDADYMSAYELCDYIVSAYPSTSYEKDARLNLFSISYIKGNLEQAERELSSIPAEYSETQEVCLAKWILYGGKYENKENNKNSIYAKNEITDNQLLGNYPNPFNPVTQIKYSLQKDSQVIIKVFDLIGSEVVTLVNEVKTSGIHNVTFDASQLSSGVYFCTMHAGDFIVTKKLMVVK